MGEKTVLPNETVYGITHETPNMDVEQLMTKIKQTRPNINTKAMENK